MNTAFERLDSAISKADSVSSVYVRIEFLQEVLTSAPADADISVNMIKGHPMYHVPSDLHPEFAICP